MKNSSNKKISQKISRRKMLLASGATAATLLIGVPAFAATATTTPTEQHSHHGKHHDFANASSTPAFVHAHTTAHAKTQNAAFGTIASIDGSTITLSHRAKNGISNITVTTTSATTYKKNGQADTASDLAVGQRIVAMGTKDSLGNVTDATSVNIFVARQRKSSETNATTTPQ